MSEVKVFSKEAVTTALNLVARGTAGLLKREEALKTLKSLPEDLALIVMQETIKAGREKAAIQARSLSQIIDHIVDEIVDKK